MGQRKCRQADDLSAEIKAQVLLCSSDGGNGDISKNYQIIWQKYIEHLIRSDRLWLIKGRGFQLLQLMSGCPSRAAEPVSMHPCMYQCIMLFGSSIGC